MDNLLEPLLDIDEIQGNSLGGFNKDHQAILTLRFGGDGKTVASVRRWLTMLLPSITWLHEVADYKQERREIIAREGAEPYMPVVWKNIAFTFTGLSKLTATANEFTDLAFRDGLNRARSQGLGDPTIAGMPGNIDSWVVGKPGEEPDVLLIIAADDDAALTGEARATMAAATAAGLICGPCDVGHDLAHFKAGGKPFPRGREHFGFKDGVSQPGVRGRVAADRFLTQPRMPDAGGSEFEPEFGAPGQPLVCAGEFVLGYGRQNESSPRAAIEPVRLGPRGSKDPDAVAPWWARNGSFVVYRRLAQDVPAFNRFLQREATRLAALPAFKELSEHRLGAMLVGRWRSGAPIIRTPLKDDPDLGAKSPANNAFGYAANFDPMDGFGPVLDDSLAEICPAAAHVRKVNPRDMGTDQGDPTHTLVRRILRRGIPYGPPLQIGAKDDPDRAERGLLFISYQASISEQFEFLISNWANDVSKPFALGPPTGSGHDLILGQVGNAHERFCLVGETMERVTTSDRFVTTTGGGYFFAPSKTALERVLSATP